MIWKKIRLLIASALLSVGMCFGQGGQTTVIRHSASLPTACQVGDTYMYINGGVASFYINTAITAGPCTWSAGGLTMPLTFSGASTVPAGASLASSGGTISANQYKGAALNRTIGFSFGTPGGTALSTGVLGYLTVPFACSITGWSIQVDAGTATVKTLKVAAGTAIPTLGSNSISTSGVAISTGTVVQSTTVTDFTTTVVTANDIVAADLITTSGVGYINFQLVCAQ